MIYEHRIYTVIPRRAELLIAHINEWFPVMEKYGVKVAAGIFQTVIGDENEISYILGYEDLAHRERAFESMRADEVFQKMAEQWAKDEPAAYNTRHKILSSTEYAASK